MKNLFLTTPARVVINTHKNYKVIFTSDTKGKDETIAIINADSFKLVAEKGYRCIAFYIGDKTTALFSADKITAIYEV